MKKESAASAIFRCFSLKKNWRQLVKYDRNKDDALIHLAKITYMIFIIYGHRFIYFIGFPKFNTELVEKVGIVLLPRPLNPINLGSSALPA